jgi:hypothetical protein
MPLLPPVISAVFPNKSKSPPVIARSKTKTLQNSKVESSRFTPDFRFSILDTRGSGFVFIRGSAGFNTINKGGHILKRYKAVRDLEQWFDCPELTVEG